MSPERAEFPPMATCEIPLPPQEPEPGLPEGLPRVLRQSAAARRRGKRALLVAALFLALSGFEILLLLKLQSRRWIVYAEPPGAMLLGGRP
jgi:hypothetical protein